MNWIAKAQQRLQTHANGLFSAWAKTKAGQRWKARKRRVSPYYCGFSLPDYHHDLIEAVGKGQEERAKWLMLQHYV